MKFRDFQLPQKIKWIEKTDKYGKFVCEPFERGYAHTVGNSLRRILLASLEGAVITSLKIEGVPHEYASIEGVKEDVLEIISNLKLLRFKVYTEEGQTISLNVSGQGEVTGADFKLNESINLLNPDVHVATLDNNASLSIEAVVERGRGYMFAGDMQKDIDTVGVIPVDASFSPVSKVNYRVENARVGQATDFDKLTFELDTDASISPEEAVAYAAQVMSRVMEIFNIPDIEEIELGEKEEEAQESEEEDLINLPIDSLMISTRVLNSLKRAGISTIYDLISKREKEVMEIDKVGDKSMEEIREQLEKFSKERGVSFELER
ncbi:MAG: DNA-directed RNA polymerase subunit alpha [Elusimicrobia bacterium]|nr:DNA-directed RNA polymerase subunit alpha [Elusimicrobiota bacterium]